MKEKRKYITIGDKTFVVATGGGFDNKFWHIIPSLQVCYDGFWRKFRIVFAFLPFWFAMWVRCDKNLKIK